MSFGIAAIFSFNCMLVKSQRVSSMETWVRREEREEFYVVSKVAKNEDAATQDDF